MRVHGSMHRIFQVNIGEKKYAITIPVRKVAVKRYARKSYPSFCKTISKSQNVNMLKPFSKQIKEELNVMCSTLHKVCSNYRWVKIFHGTMFS